MLIKDRDWCRPDHVIFVSFPSSFPLSRLAFGLTTRSALPASGLPPTEKENRGAHRIVCRRCAKKSKMAIEAEIEFNNFVYYINRKCRRVPLISIEESCFVCSSLCEKCPIILH